MVRLNEIPHNLMVSVRLGLWRAENQSGGYVGRHVLFLTRDRYVSCHNVSLVTSWKGLNETEAFWAILISVNETTQSWQQEKVVRPIEAMAGEYEGVVNQTIEAKGIFRLWILLYSCVNGSRILKDSKSELVSTYSWLWPYSISSGRLSPLISGDISVLCRQRVLIVCLLILPQRSS
jgi:hypothetical protein